LIGLSREDRSVWNVLFWVGVTATILNLALLTLLAANPLPLWENRIYLLCAAIILGVAVGGITLRLFRLKRLSGGLMTLELLPQAFWGLLLLGVVAGIDVLDVFFPAQPSVAASRPTD